MMEAKRVKAIVWDYDGTLVDTTPKNLNVTRKIIRTLTKSNPDDIPVLRSLEVYQAAINESSNWRELYTRKFGVSEAVAEAAGSLWNSYHEQDNTPTPLYDGIDTVLSGFPGVPQGIVSGNSRGNITHVLTAYELIDHFGSVIGYEELEIDKQKPEADGLLLCLWKITKLAPGIFFFIGDHEVDAWCAANCNEAFRKLGLDSRVYSIGALYGPTKDASTWKIKPDIIVNSPGEIASIIREYA